MLVLIVLYDTYHIEVEASVHFGSFLYITGLDVIDVDNLLQCLHQCMLCC